MSILQNHKLGVLVFPVKSFVSKRGATVFLMNHKPEIAAFGAFHLLHSGQHYDAFLYYSDDKNLGNTLDLAARNSNDHRTVIDLGVTRETQNHYNPTTCF
jgi:hypothetical protein